MPQRVRSKRRSKGGVGVRGGRKVSTWEALDGEKKVAEVRRGRVEVGDWVEEGVEEDMYTSVKTKSKIIERA